MDFILCVWLPRCCRESTWGPPWRTRGSSRWCWWWWGCWCYQKTRLLLVWFLTPSWAMHVYFLFGILKSKENIFYIRMIFYYWTCVPERDHHDKTKDDIDRETTGHFYVGRMTPLFVFLDGEPPHIPVFKRRRKIETEKKVKKLV